MDVHGRGLEVVFEVRADVRDLCAGAAEITHGHGMLVVEAVIDLHDAVVTVVSVE